jgi:transaldolase
MHIFLDTANIDEIREMAQMGIIEGVTTNPSILSRESVEWKYRIKEILATVKGAVFVEILSQNTQGMVEEAEEIAAWSNRIVIKIPIIPEGIKAMYILSGKKITTAATLIFSPSQAVIASSVGVKYVAPFIGRSFEISQDGVQIVKDIADVFKLQNLDTKIIAASVRTAQDAIRVLLAGANCITVSYSVMKQMISHPMTGISLNKFMEDWNNARQIS